MRTLLLALLAITTATAGTSAVLYSTGSSHRSAVEPIAVPDFEYRFYNRFCRAQYNNPMDRLACMIRATGTLLDAPYSERDDR
jgi:hypothetical protein